MSQDEGEATIKLHQEIFQPDLVFFATWFCPFAQRTWIALEEKGIRYAWRECVLYETSASSKCPLPLEAKAASDPEWVRCSPRGLVPALLHGTAMVSESLVCVEYVDEITTLQTQELLPGGPALRARVRAAISFVSDKIVPPFYKCLMSPDTPTRQSAAAALIEALIIVGNMMDPVSEELDLQTDTFGGFFLGSKFSAFECALWPHYQRIPIILGTYRGVRLDDDPRLERMDMWAKAVAARPSVRRTIVDEARLMDNYSGYADGNATSDAAIKYAKN